MSPVIGRLDGLGAVVAFGPVSGTAPLSLTESSATQLSPDSPIVAQDLTVKLTVAPGVAATRSFTLRVNGTDTLVTCTISDAENSCGSGVTSTTILAGSELSIGVSSTGVPAPASAMFGWRATST